MKTRLVSRETRKRLGARWTCVLVVALCCLLSGAAALAEETNAKSGKTNASASDARDARPLAPAQLAVWKDWVLYKSEYLYCPASMKDATRHICSFPGRLKLQVSKSEGAFTLQLRLYDRGRAVLPTGKGLWPEQVRLNGKEVSVVEAGGAPVIFLEAGEYEISGRIAWSEPPEFLQLPVDAGLVQLIKEGVVEPFPDFAPDGKLVLAARSAAKSPEDSLEVTVFRKFRDALPAEITTHVRLEVAGKARRIALQNILPPHGTPLAISSPVPLRFGPEGGVDVQAGPGRWEIEVVTRLEGPITALGPLATPYGREFWAFQAESELRVVEVGGPPAVDPQTTSMPGDWKRFPAYMVDAGAVLKFQEMHRGAADSTVDALTLDRTLWLDYAGRGLTVRDQIGGAVRQSWTLTMPPPAALGRVTLDGKDESILLLGPNQVPGVELRKGVLNLTAESRYERFDGTLSCTGWDRDFQSVKAVLHLPPGWRLFAATGVDAISDSWVSRWTLWDIFFGLVLSLAIMKLRRPFVGVWALLFFALSYHETGSPQYVWIFVLAALGLVQAFDGAGKLAEWVRTRRAAYALYGVALLSMLAVAAPFVLQQIRLGMYPQLEQIFEAPSSGLGGGLGNGMDMKAGAMQEAAGDVPDSMAPAEESPAKKQRAARPSSPAPAPAPRAKTSYSTGAQKKDEPRQLMMYDPEALVQTGPGVPAWQWRRVTLGWNGPVARGESLGLWLISPAANLALALARVLFLCLTLWPLVDLKRFRMPPAAAKAATNTTSTAVAGALLALFCAAGLLWSTSGQALAEDFPPDALLQTYRERLIEPAPCFPNCAASPHLEVQLDQERLRLVYTIHLAAAATVPLPVVSERWQPREVLLDERPAQLYREAGALWLLAPEGAHRVILEGPAPRAVSFQIALPLGSKRAKVTAPGWNTQGVAADGRVEGALHLARLQQADQDGKLAPAGETYRIPPFLHIERKLTLGLTWEVATTVRRVTPTGEPIVLEASLLPGEAVLTEAVEVKDGRIRLNMGPGDSVASWRSRLEAKPELVLTAPVNVPWVETWTLTASPIWDLTIQGAPVVRRLDGQNVWTPVWRPWPGEKVTIAVARPKAAPGSSLTIEEVSLATKAGARLDENKLSLRVRASKGGRQTLRIPAEAEVLSFRNQEREFPKIGDKPGELTFPVSPGVQTVEVAWRQTREGASLLGPPAVRLPQPAVNVALTLDVPRDRWTLFIWGGPRQGPAVLYWSYLGGMLLLSFALGYLPWTPLKRWQWLALGLGLSQVDMGAAGLAVAWLVALGLRREHFPKYGWFWFNLLQLSLIALTLLGLGGLYDAVRQGLLGHPEMQIRGNGSNWLHLIWGQDRVADALPLPVVFTAPLYAYRLTMLAWCLWLAASLLTWLRWGWDCFVQGGLFRRPQFGFKFAPAMRRGPATQTTTQATEMSEAKAEVKTE